MGDVGTTQRGGVSERWATGARWRSRPYGVSLVVRYDATSPNPVASSYEPELVWVNQPAV